MDTIELIKLAKLGDKQARDLVVTENIGLVHSIVRRFLGRGQEAEDLFQIGCIGLLKAVDHFDTDYDVKLSTYAVPLITGEIKRFLRDDGMIKVSRSLKETAMKIRTAQDAFEKRFGREPTLEEIGTELAITREEIVLALESGSEVESLYKTIYQGDGNAVYLIDRLEESEDENAKVVDRYALQEVFAGLPEKEKTLIRMRYFEEKTQVQVAQAMGISQVQVSRLEKKTLLAMREKMNG